MQLKPLLYTLLFLVLMSCNYPKRESYSIYTIVPKIDDELSYILTSTSQATYLCKTSRKPDLQILKDLGEFLTDKNGVYRKYDISDGVLILDLEEADLETFRVFNNSVYAKDKNHIYSSRHGIIKTADIKTFEIIHTAEPGSTVYGKDKNSHYFWDEIVVDTLNVNKKMNFK